MRWPAAVLALGLVAVASSARAQAGNRASLDFTYGAATSWGGAQDYLARNTAAWQLTFVPDNRGSRFVALTLGGRPQGAMEGICQPAPDGSGCGPDFPSMTDLGIGVGMQRGEPAGRVRAILGPMFYLGDFRAGGVRLQLDAAGGWQHLQFVLAARGDLVRRGAENFRLGSLELGLRLID